MASASSEKNTTLECTRKASEMGKALRVAAVLLCYLNLGKSIEIDRSDGGYKNVLVSISESVPYDNSTVDGIKALFRSSSEFLHKATDGRTYFKHVVIEIPKTWPDRAGARTLSSSSFEQSDVRVDLPAAPHGDRPFTQQLRPCGQPGDFIQLSPSFLAQVNETTAAESESQAAYAFVHEWAHFRYGVFDEHGSPSDPRHPLTYCHDGKVKLNACSEKIGFRARTADGEKCGVDSACRLAKDCVVSFHQPSTDDPVESSIMFMPYIDNVTQFCDETFNGVRHHNPFAPNEQNYLCKQRSSWEVINSNADFQSLPRPDKNKRVEVSFEEVQHKEQLAQRVVLVLDVSESMLEHSRLKFLKRAAKRYIEGIADGTRRLAIIVFNGKSEVVHTLMPVNIATRGGFLRAIEGLEATGATCIGCGLRRALTVLKAPSETPEGAIVVLMSDGEETRGMRISEMAPRLIQEKVVVNTLALGAEADPKLEKLASDTRGKSYAFQDLHGNVVLEMEAAFVEATTSAADLASRALTLVDAEHVLDKILEMPFHVDTGVGNETVVYVKSNSFQSVQMDAWLIDPSGQRCQSCHQSTDGSDIVLFISSPAQAGKWILHVAASGSGKVLLSIQVKSRARKEDAKPIQATCRMNSMVVDRPDAAIIYTTVSRGHKVVLDAAVIAKIYGPKQVYKPTLQLHDDGRDPDNLADDGTYSGYFTAFTGKGRYAVTVYVSHQKTARLAFPAGGSGYGVDGLFFNDHTAPTARHLDSASEYPLDNFVLLKTMLPAANASELGEETLEPFQRVASGGSFQVTEPILEVHVPPGGIRDLARTDVRPGENGTLKVKLTWTWPGAHLTERKASSLEIRAGKDYAKIKSDFESQIKITKDNIVEGNLDPLPPGASQHVVLSLPNVFAKPSHDGALRWEAYLAARLTNDHGLKSNISNVVQLLYTHLLVTTTVTSTTEITTPPVTTSHVSGSEEALKKEASTTISPPLSAESVISKATTAVALATAATFTTTKSATNEATSTEPTTAASTMTEETTTAKTSLTARESITTIATVIPRSSIVTTTADSTAEASPIEPIMSEDPTVSSAFTTVPSMPYLLLTTVPRRSNKYLDAFLSMSKWMPIGGAITIVVGASLAAVLMHATPKNRHRLRAFLLRRRPEQDTPA